MYNNKRIIVSMTSWKKRINNVAKVIYSIHTNSIKPDTIELNLSFDEFTNKENDLPKELLLLASNGIVNINWVKENTGVFKKFIPVLQKYKNEDFYLFSIDDDWLYSNDYIKMMLSRLKDGNYFSLQNKNLVIGNSTVYRSICFKEDFWELITEDLIKVGISDPYITGYLTKHNYKQANGLHETLYKWAKLFNPVFSNSGNNKIDGNGNYEKSRVDRAYSIINKILEGIK